MLDKRIELRLTARDVADLDRLNGVTRSDKVRRAIALAVEAERRAREREEPSDRQAAD